jgi:hypothetical protein
MAARPDLHIAQAVVTTCANRRGHLPELTPANIGPSLMTGLDWLVFDLERTIGLRPCSAEEAHRTASLIEELLVGYKEAVAFTSCCGGSATVSS